MKLLFYDLETSGLDFNRNAILQIAAILIDIDVEGSFSVIDAINLKMRPSPEKIIDKGALNVNGLTMDEIETYPDQEEAFAKFIAFLDRNVERFKGAGRLKLSGYNNVHFDADFLSRWFIDNGNDGFYSYFYIDQIDVMCEASRYLLYYRDGVNNMKLGNVAKVLGIKTDDTALHDAFYDIKLTIKVFRKIISAGTPFMPFDQDTAIRIFTEQQEEKVKLRKKKEEAELASSLFE